MFTNPLFYLGLAYYRNAPVWQKYVVVIGIFVYQRTIIFNYKKKCEHLEKDIEDSKQHLNPSSHYDSSSSLSSCSSSNSSIMTNFDLSSSLMKATSNQYVRPNIITLIK